MPYLGAYWRRRLLFDLLAAPNIARSILDQFDRDPSIGMIGSRTFHLPSATIPLEPSWAKTRPRVLELATRMGVPPERFRLDFFGGTMFWVRPEALRPLRDLCLSLGFPEETGLLDGGVEHTIERLFATSVVAAGYQLKAVDGFEVCRAGAVQERTSQSGQ
jgi:lipopolysaccharide biosynthesis protein